MQKFFKFFALVCIICSVTTSAVIAENNDSVDGADDATAVSDSIAEDNTETANWLRRATDKVKDAVNLEEWLEEAKKQGEQLLDERGRQVFEQAQQIAKTLTETPLHQNEPTPGLFDWILLYCWYAFCSPYAFFAYVTMILFTLFWQYVIERNKRRVFSGSPVYCFILCLSAIIGIAVTLNMDWQGTLWELAWRNDTFIGLLPNSMVLLICYFRVSMVPEEHYEKGEDRFCRSLSRGFQGDDWTGIIYLVLGVLFAPVLICIKFLLNYVFVHSTLSLKMLKQNE